MAYGTINAEQLTTQSGYTLGAGNASSFKNRILNGSMVIDQRNAGASVTPTSTAADTYSLDRWCTYGSSASKFSVQQNAGGVTPPTGFKNYLGVTSLAATAVGASDQYYLAQYIEGFNTADLMFGSASASSVTLSFWVRSSLTGTFGGSFTNSALNRSYPFTYTISAINTWEQKTITIAGDTTGTWVGATNGVGARVHFGLGIGSTFSGTAGAWAGSSFISSTGATSVVGTNGATFYITGVQLEVGTVATSFDYRSYGTELALCQRYCFSRLGSQGSSSGNGIMIGWAGNARSSSTAYIVGSLPTTMRTYPSLTIINPTSFILYQTSAINAISITLDVSDPNGVSLAFTTAAVLTSPTFYNMSTNNGNAQLILSAEL